jgi:phosphopantothenoylcysteine decarboxylase/phosphopantothenate--cysteine ligase
MSGKKILFGMCGSIAAYKAAGWVRELSKEEVRVTVVMTEAATRFVSSLTLASLSGQRVYTDMFADDAGEEMSHISLAGDCDLIVVAPATAQTIARLAHGLADDLLSTVILAATARVLIFPAMNSRMYCHPATQSNLNKLRKYGYQVIEPGEGLLACGEEGIGKLVEWDVGCEAILSGLVQQDLTKKTILITAGPTRESLDPARHLSNRSTGKMGYALARTAKRRGASVILISGPTSLPVPPDVKIIKVTSAAEMHDAVMKWYNRADVIVKSAAVSDYRPAKALSKLKDKNLDLVVINDIIGRQSGFGTDTNQVILADRKGQVDKLPLLTKEDCGDRIWDKIITLLG